MYGVCKTICECVDQQPGLHIVKGHQSLIVVHIDSNSGWSDIDCQAGGGFCSEGVVSAIPQAEEPVTVGGTYSDFALSDDRAARHSQVPVSLFSNLHLEKGMR